MTRLGGELRGQPLSPRELGVLSLIAEGNSNGDIGLRLYLSEDTVKTHVRRLLRKLGATDRAHAVHLGHLSGVFDVPRPPLACGAFVAPGAGSLVKPLAEGRVRCGQPVDSHATGRFAAALDPVSVRGEARRHLAALPRSPLGAGQPTTPTNPRRY